MRGRKHGTSLNVDISAHGYRCQGYVKMDCQTTGAVLSSGNKFNFNFNIFNGPINGSILKSKIGTRPSFFRIFLIIFPMSSLTL